MDFILNLHLDIYIFIVNKSDNKKRIKMAKMERW